MYFYLPTQNYPKFESFVENYLENRILETSLESSLTNNLETAFEINYTLELSTEDSAHLISMRKKGGDVLCFCDQQGSLFLGEFVSLDKKSRRVSVLLIKIVFKKSSKKRQQILFQAVLDKDYLEKFFETVAFSSFDTVYLFVSDFSPNPSWIKSLLQKKSILNPKFFENLRSESEIEPVLLTKSKEKHNHNQSGQDNNNASTKQNYAGIKDFKARGFQVFESKDIESAFVDRLKRILIRSGEQCERVFRPKVIFLDSTSAYRLIQIYTPKVADTVYNPDNHNPNFDNSVVTINKGLDKIDNMDVSSVVIGPEGGFSAREREFFGSIKLQSVSLGEIIYPGWACHLFWK